MEVVLDVLALRQACSLIKNKLYCPVPERPCVRVESDGRRTVTVANDMYRLYYNESRVINRGVEFALNIDPCFIDALVSCKFDNGFFKVCKVEEGKISFTKGNLSISADLVSGDYPDWRRVAYYKLLYAVEIDSDEFVGALRGLRYCVSGILLDFQPNGEMVYITITDAKGQKRNLVGETVGASVPVKMRINKDYLRHGLKLYSGEKVRLCYLPEDRNPIALRPIYDREKVLYIMPIRFEE